MATTLSRPVWSLCLENFGSRLISRRVVTICFLHMSSEVVTLVPRLGCDFHDGAQLLLFLVCQCWGLTVCS